MYTVVTQEYFEQMPTCDTCPIDDLDIQDLVRRGRIMEGVTLVQANSDVEILPEDHISTQMRKLGLRGEYNKNTFGLSGEQAQAVIACGLCKAAGECALNGTEKER